MILVDNLAKRYGDVIALRDVSLAVESGEFLVLLGPSGSGKTTLLRCVAGLEVPSGGEIRLEDRVVFSEYSSYVVPPRERNIGMVFQSFALYPHMNVFENVAFGLKIKKTARGDIAERVEAALEMVGLTALARRRPKQLSGGQQQRVALARTIASRPRYLLFDEPLSNLDPKLRVALRTQLKQVHKRLGTTSLYVTHDQNEAMILADVIAVLHNGRIAQLDAPRKVYRYPATPAVAEYTANPRTNLIRGELHRTAGRLLLIPRDDPYCFLPLPQCCAAAGVHHVILHARPEDVEMVRNPSADEGSLFVVLAMPQGSDTFVYLEFDSSSVASDQKPTAIITRGEPEDATRLSRGDRVGLRFLRGNLYDPDTRRLIGSFDRSGHYLTARTPDMR
ncbi:MAG: ABC transporter ATP-binding protein [Spirochaetaceae bacterium]|nr:MAG: ABC transporter ATP-binding protein [Spirochaetaceae bacterium]